ncbi:hypothetical protein BH11PSE2_BH11PSE2_18150 [soil metagenome]
MKTLLIALAAAASVAVVAAPAAAQPRNDAAHYDNGGYDNRGNDRGYDNRGYDRRDDRRGGERWERGRIFQSEALQYRVDRAYHAGQLSRGEERTLTQWVRELGTLEHRYARNGWVSRDEARDLQERAQRIEMRLRYMRNDDGYGRGGYGRGGYGRR